ncbi:hypothetical protein CARUB_v10001391mg [Capsella rubella]|uniref:Uncharacterized protein n=1 Tax=Capsella rubella TaxID=81985 RepID=R0H848_9BRAS|nr:UPF0725 protein EMB2204 [Capsella rubella]EOA21050.1 hypothetical protein CARUB_v10001391mg [Capsella rubella]
MMMRQQKAMEAFHRYPRDDGDKLAPGSSVYDLNSSTYGYLVNICKQEYPCPPLVFLYAKMSLHRYNFAQGTMFELIRVQKYVKSTGSANASYYMTLDAIDSAGSLQTFQNKVSEYSVGRFILTCPIARIRGEPIDGKGFSTLVDSTLPECPAVNPFDTYYLVKESELLENPWIRLYLELAVAKTDRHYEDRGAGLADLEIVDVAIDEGQGLNANNAVFYIRYKDLYKANPGHDLVRIAIVRRNFDEAMGRLTLVGQTQSSDVIPNMTKIANEEDTGCSSFKGQIQSPEHPTQISSPLGISEDHEEANQLAMMNLRVEEAAGDSMELDSPSAQDA